MRTSLPHGMSQHNRIHPYFLILRRYAEDEELISRKIIESYLLSMVACWFAMVLFACCFGSIPRWSEVPRSTIREIAFIIGPVGITVFFSVVVYREIKDIAKHAVFPEVNKMLSSDDYSGADLNYEKVFNMICQCAENIGSYEFFGRMLRVSRIGAVLIVISSIIYAIVSKFTM